jgi:hypothetical protein
MSFANLPPAVATLLQALHARDRTELLGMFNASAVLVDHGNEYRGDALEEWCGRACRGAVATAHPINVTRQGPKTALTVMLRADDKDGGAGPAEFDWGFTVEGGKISDLTITGRKTIELPEAVAAYVRATNTFDLDALMATFVDGALVNDQLCEYWGKPAIREWAEREVVGLHVTMYVVKLVEHYGHAVVTANVDGDYDKRGLPDPLVLTFYFSAHRDKIAQLIILRNEPRAL